VARARLFCRAARMVSLVCCNRSLYNTIQWLILKDGAANFDARRKKPGKRPRRRKNPLTRDCVLCYDGCTSFAGLFFCAHFSMRRLRQEGGYLMEVPKNESEDHPCLHGVQTAQLQHQEEQEEQSRQARDEEVLPLLQKAYRSPRDEVRKADMQHG